MPWKIPTWIAWPAGVCAQQCGVARYRATTQRLKSVGHTVCFESPFLIVVMSHGTIPTWLLLLDSWMLPAKHLFWPQKSVALNFLPWNVCLNFLGFGKPLCSLTVDCFFHFTIAVRNPGLFTVTVWSINFSLSSFYRWRNVKADVTRCFFVHVLAFWAPILHRLHCSADSLQQFHRLMYVQFVENILITLKLWTENFHKFCCWLFQQGHHSWRVGGASLIFITCEPSLNCLNHCQTFPSLITLGP